MFHIMNHTNNAIYLNTAACGLIPEAAVQAGNSFNTALQINSSIRAADWKASEANRIRNTIAHFIGAPEQNVAMMPNFSFAINCLVQSLKGTERILLFRKDFPSLTDPFKINNFDITWIDTTDEFTISLEEINSLIETQKIDIVAISHVQWSSGLAMDLKELGALCKQHGVRLIIDGTQSLGAIPVNLSALPVDVFIASNYKWMNAGFGTGILYITDDFLKKYPPVVAGNNSYVLQNGQLTYRPSMRSYEPGHLNMSGLLLLEAAIQDKNNRGMEAIAAHTKKLTQLFLE